jgi:hypothetical protein
MRKNTPMRYKGHIQMGIGIEIYVVQVGVTTVISSIGMFIHPVCKQQMLSTSALYEADQPFFSDGYLTVMVIQGVK